MLDGSHHLLLLGTILEISFLKGPLFELSQKPEKIASALGLFDPVLEIVNMDRIRVGEYRIRVKEFLVPSPHASGRDPYAAAGRIIEFNFGGQTILDRVHTSSDFPVYNDLQPLKRYLGYGSCGNTQSRGPGETNLAPRLHPIHTQAHHGTVRNEGGTLLQSFHPTVIGQRNVQPNIYPLMANGLGGFYPIGSGRRRDTESTIQKCIPQAQVLRDMRVCHDVRKVNLPLLGIKGKFPLAGTKVSPIHQTALFMSLFHNFHEQGEVWRVSIPMKRKRHVQGVKTHNGRPMETQTASGNRLNYCL